MNKKYNILVAEDNQPLLNLMTIALKKEGYEVISVPNGSEAVMHLNKLKDKIDLVLTDYILPDMNGKDLSQIATGLNPHIKLVFTSGYANLFDKHETNIQFIQKPFTLNKLVENVRYILNGGETAIISNTKG
jgi:DNA-binding NtrC family response regulator